MAHPTELRIAVVNELSGVADVRPDRTVPTALVRYRAEELNVGESTVWRWLHQAGLDRPDGRRTHAELSDRHLEVIVACGGNLTRAKQKLDQEDPEIAAMSERTFRRRWDDQPADVRAMATGGIEAALQQQLRLAYEAPERNQVWHIDHQELPIWILPDGGRSPAKPWMTTVIDDCTRKIMAAVLTVERPNTETLLVTVAEAVRIRTENGIQVGGVPVELHSDNGGEFKSVAYRQTLAAIGVQRTTTYPHMKHQNGKVERVQRTIQDEFVAGLIGYAHAGKTLSRKDLFGIDGPILSEEVFVGLLDGWIDEYNHDRKHTAIGTTPNQKWASFAGPLRHPDDEALRMAMLPSDKPRKVQQRGVFFDNQYYTSARLAPWIGRKVQVRYFPHDQRLVEVFDLKGNWICTAYSQATLTDTQAEEIRNQAQTALTSVRELQKRAAERRRADALADPDLASGIAEDHKRPDTNSLLGSIDDYLDYDDGIDDDDGEEDVKAEGETEMPVEDENEVEADTEIAEMTEMTEMTEMNVKVNKAETDDVEIAEMNADKVDNVVHLNALNVNGELDDEVEGDDGDDA